MRTTRATGAGEEPAKTGGRIHEHVHDRGDAEERGGEIHQPGEETSVTAEGDFDVGVESAGERDPRTRAREAGHENRLGDRADHEGHGRRAAEHFRHRSREDEDARADRGVDDVGRECGNADGAHQAFALSGRFGRHRGRLARRRARDKLSRGAAHMTRAERLRKAGATGLGCATMRASHLEDYYTFLRFPSISTDDEYSEKVAECAHWLVEKLTGIGLEAKLVPTPGHPVVWAKNKHQPGRKTVMIYGHYDVQPPDPLDLWDSPPFDPVLKDGYVYRARRDR